MIITICKAPPLRNQWSSLGPPLCEINGLHSKSMVFTRGRGPVKTIEWDKAMATELNSTPLASRLQAPCRRPAGVPAWYGKPGPRRSTKYVHQQALVVAKSMATITWPRKQSWAECMHVSKTLGFAIDLTNTSDMSLIAAKTLPKARLT